MTSTEFAAQAPTLLENQLHQAVINNNIPQALSLLKQGANVNQSLFANGATALMFAAKLGYTDMAECLIANQANIHQSTTDGYTALSIAILHGHTGVMQHILYQDQDVTVNKPIADTIFTPLMLAIFCGKAAVVQCLLNNHADVHQPFPCGNSPLMYAAQLGNVAIIRCLIRHPAHVNQVNPQTGTTALFFAIFYGHLNVVQYLVENHADIHQEMTEACYTPLMLAALRNCPAIIKYLIDKGAIVNHANADGITALMVATDQGHLTASKLLIANKATICEHCLKLERDKGCLDLLQRHADAQRASHTHTLSQPATSSSLLATSSTSSAPAAAEASTPLAAIAPEDVFDEKTAISHLQHMQRQIDRLSGTEPRTCATGKKRGLTSDDPIEIIDGGTQSTSHSTANPQDPATSSDSYNSCFKMSRNI